MNNFLDFITNTNVIEVRNVEDFCRFLEMLKKHQVIDILKEDRRCYSWWKKMAIMNGKNPDLLLFEYRNGKGLTFTDDYDRAVEWYGQKPIQLLEDPTYSPHTALEIMMQTKDLREEDCEEEFLDEELANQPEINIEADLTEDKTKWTFTISFGDTPAGMGTMSYEGETKEEAIEKIRKESKIDQLYAQYYGEEI